MILISDAARDGQIATVVTIVATLLVIAFLRFGHLLDAAYFAGIEEEAQDEDELRTLARVAHSIDGMDSREREKLELFV